MNEFKKLFKELKTDEELYYAWQANIAMAFKDEFQRCKKKYKNNDDLHRISNQAAKNFLDLLIK